MAVSYHPVYQKRKKNDSLLKTMQYNLKNVKVAATLLKSASICLRSGR